MRERERERERGHKNIRVLRKRIKKMCVERLFR